MLTSLNTVSLLQPEILYHEVLCITDYLKQSNDNLCNMWISKYLEIITFCNLYDYFTPLGTSIATPHEVYWVIYHM